MNYKAFNESVLPAKDKLFRFAYRLTNSKMEAEDIVQEVFIKIWNKKSDWESVRNMEAFMMRIAKNLALDKLKSSHHKLNVELDGREDYTPGNTTPPDKSTEMSDLVNNIHQMIEQLPVKQKMIVQLRDIEGCSYKEIGEILDLDMNQVKVNLFRARNTLKDYMTKLNSYGISKNTATS